MSKCQARSRGLLVVLRLRNSDIRKTVGTFLGKERTSVRKLIFGLENTKEYSSERTPNLEKKVVNFEKKVYQIQRRVILYPPELGPSSCGWSVCDGQLVVTLSPR